MIQGRWSFEGSGRWHLSQMCAANVAKLGGKPVVPLAEGEGPSEACGICARPSRSRLPSEPTLLERLKAKVACEIADELAAGEWVPPAQITRYRAVARRIEETT